LDEEQNASESDGMNLTDRLERERMVEEQIAARGISDPCVLDAMKKVPRHRFVSPSRRQAAYTDRPLPIGREQTISQPYMVALMTQALELSGREKTLEIGTGSGYQTAILAELSSQVYTIERIAPLLEKAEETLSRLGYTNIRFKIFNGTEGWPEHAPYDAIIVTAGAPQVPDPLREQLAEGGRLVIPVGDRTAQELLWIKREHDTFVSKNLGGCRFVQLLGAHGWRSRE
jgi:protein-L-isoaspartate(D-aspartate) O-methyltransferase